MFAIYEPTRPGMTLNIRETPDAGAAVVGALEEGEPIEVETIDHGWCKVDGGYIDARFVVVKPSDSTPELENGNDDQTDDPSDSTPELENMTTDELYDLAKQSGIKVRSNMKRETLISAILAGAND